MDVKVDIHGSINIFIHVHTTINDLGTSKVVKGICGDHGGILGHVICVRVVIGQDMTETS